MNIQLGVLDGPEISQEQLECLRQAIDGRRPPSDLSDYVANSRLSTQCYNRLAGLNFDTWRKVSAGRIDESNDRIRLKVVAWSGEVRYCYMFGRKCAREVARELRARGLSLPFFVKRNLPLNERYLKATD